MHNYFVQCSSYFVILTGSPVTVVTSMVHAVIGIEADFTASGWVGAKSCFHRTSYSDEIAPPADNVEEACRRYGLEPHLSLEPTKVGKTLNGCISEPASHEVAPPTNIMEKASQRYQLPSKSSIEPTSSEKILNGCVPDAIRQEMASSLRGSDSETQKERTACDKMTSISSSASTVGSCSSFEAPLTPAGLEEVRYEVLMEATAGFDRTPYKEGGHKVGEGGFGEVFQCSLVLQRGPVHAAVKVLLNKVR